MDDRQFRVLLDLLGLSWKGYRKVRRGVQKRMVRHMQSAECRSFAQFLRTLGGK